MGDDRASVYYEGDNLIFRASAFGNCDGELVRHGLGYPAEPHPQWLQEKFDQGTVAEDDIVARLCEKYGAKLIDHPNDLHQYGTVQESTGQLEVEYKVGRSIIRCHPDGIVQIYKKHKAETGYEVGERLAIEVKLLTESTMQEYRRKGIKGLWGYAYQASIEMLGTGLPLIYGMAVKDKDGLPRRDKNGDIILYTKIYREPPYSEAEIRRRLLLLTGRIRNETIPECSKKQYPCQFYTYEGAACNNVRELRIGGKDDAGGDLDSDIPSSTLTEVQLLGSVYQEAQKQEADWKSKKNAARDKLVELLKGLGRDKIGPVKVVNGRSAGKYDWDAAEQDGVDLQKYWVQGSEYKYVKIEKEK